MPRLREYKASALKGKDKRSFEFVLRLAHTHLSTWQGLVKAIFAIQPVCRHDAATLDFTFAASFNMVAAKTFQDSGCCLTHVNTQSKATGFHARSNVDSVTEEAIARHLGANNAGNSWARVNTNTQLELLLRQVTNAMSHHGTQHMEGHGSNFASVLVAISSWKTRYHHVGITDGFHLVDIVVFDDCVETSVQIIQHVNNLKWCTLTAYASESDDIREEDGDFIKAFSLDVFAELEILNNLAWQHPANQILHLLFLRCQLFSSFTNNSFQILRVFFQHRNEIVDHTTFAWMKHIESLLDFAERGTLSWIRMPALLHQLTELKRHG
eukprot:m.33483 g.33483  ORF g.33483 m.33483 type:complete len:325 (-) comp10890_c1_seq1:1150-2124(-)